MKTHSSNAGIFINIMEKNAIESPVEKTMLNLIFSVISFELLKNIAPVNHSIINMRELFVYG
jgi:hypothetical protein